MTQDRKGQPPRGGGRQTRKTQAMRGTGRHHAPGEDERHGGLAETKHRGKPDLYGKWDTIAFREVLKKVAEVRTVAYLLVSDGRSEKCIFFPVGGLRMTSVGHRRGAPLRKAILAHPRCTPAMAKELDQAQAEGDQALGDVLGGELRKIGHECSKRIVTDELLDLITWDGAEYEYRESNPPPSVFDPDLEAVKLSLGVKKLLGEIEERIGHWKELQRDLGQPSKTMVFKGSQAPKGKGAGQAIVGAVYRRGPKGCPLEDAMIAGRRSGWDALRSAEHVLQLSKKGALTLEVSPAPLDKAAKRARARKRLDELGAIMQQLVNRLAAHRRMAEHHMDLGDEEQAVANLRIVAEELEEREDQAGAIETYRGILGISPHAFFAREQIAELLESLKKGPEALREWLALARSYAGFRLFNRAQDGLGRAIALDKTDKSLRRYLIDTLLSMGKNREAAGEYEKLAKICEAEGQEEEALACYEQVALLDPDNQEAQKRLAAAMRKGASFAKHYVLIALALALLVGAGLFVTDRYQTLQKLTEAQAQAMQLAQEKKFADARKVLDTFRVETGYESHRLDEALAGIAALEALEAQRQFEEAAAHQAEGRVPEARKRFGLIRDQFGTTEWGAKAAERLAAIRKLRDEALILAGEVGDLSAEGKHEEAFKKARDLFRRFPWSAAAKGCSAPLRVETVPTQALLSVNGESQGHAPGVVEHTGPEPFELRATREGYEPLTLEVDLTGKTPFPLELQLQKELRWQLQTLGPLDQPPSASGATVLVAGSDQRIYALSKRGERLWTRTLPPFTQTLGSPAKYGDAVVVSDAAGIARGYSADEGKLLWKRKLRPELRCVGTLKKIGVILAAPDRMWALNPSNGKVRWRVELPGALAAPPVIDPDKRRVLSVTKNGFLAVVDAEKGKLFKVKVTGRPVCPPTAVPGAALVATEDGSLKRVWKGEEWSVDLGAPAADAPLFASGRVYVPVGSKLLALSAEDGSKIWAQDLGAPVSTPVFRNQRIYASSPGGQVFGLVASSGKVRWVFETGGALSGSPTLTHDTVLVGSRDFRLYAIADD